MKRVQRPQRSPQPRPPRSAAAAARPKSTTPTRPSPAKPPRPTPTRPAAASPALEAPKVAMASGAGDAAAAERAPRRGLGSLGRQSLLRQLPTITLAVERPRAMPAPPSQPQIASAPPSRGSAGGAVATASLLALRDGLRSLLGLLDAPYESAKM